MVDNICTWQGKTDTIIKAKRTKTGDLFAPVKLKFRHKKLTVVAFGVIASALDGIGKDTSLSIVGTIFDRNCRKCKHQHPNIVITSFSLDKGKSWIDEALLSGVKSLSVDEYNESLRRESGKVSELQDLADMDLNGYFERDPDSLPTPEHDFVNDQPW